MPPPRAAAISATADPASTGDPQTLAGLTQSLVTVTTPFPGPGAHNAFFVPSKSLASRRFDFLNVIAPLLPFVLGHGASFFDGFQDPPFDGCSAASSDFFTGGECTSFYYTIFLYS